MAKPPCTTSAKTSLKKRPAVGLFGKILFESLKRAPHGTADTALIMEASRTTALAEVKADRRAIADHGRK